MTKAVLARSLQSTATAGQESVFDIVPLRLLDLPLRRQSPGSDREENSLRSLAKCRASFRLRSRRWHAETSEGSVRGCESERAQSAKFHDTSYESSLRLRLLKHPLKIQLLMAEICLEPRLSCEFRLEVSNLNEQTSATVFRSLQLSAQAGTR